MGAIGAYLVKVTAAALICGLVKALLPDGALATALRMTTGILMLLALINPWMDGNMFNFGDWPGDLRLDAEAAVHDGAVAAADTLRESISTELTAYIQEKAVALGAELTVELILTEGSLPVPQRVLLRGQISPYGKSVLSEYLQKDLGIEKEEQIWIT